MSVEFANAVRSGNASRIRELIGRGAATVDDFVDGLPAVIVCCLIGHVDAIKTLVSLGASVNTAFDGFTPAYIAAQKGHVDAIKTLVSLGASVNTAFDGYTPVYASRRLICFTVHSRRWQQLQMCSRQCTHTSWLMRLSSNL